MSVSSKWYVTHIEGNAVSFNPVCRGVENREWAQATPGGSMQMFIQNDAAREQFRLYEEYEVVFTHSPKPAPGDGHAVQVVEQKDSYGSEKVYYSCGRCGSYASLNEDGTPDWTKHEEHFGKAE
jgi:hypothetical protein